jgi:hypothetical protein
MHRHLVSLLVLGMVGIGAAAADMDRNIMVPPVVGKTIEIDVDKGDTLHYSFDVIDPEGACVDFSEMPAFGSHLNQPCVRGGSDSRLIQDSGRYKLKFTTKGSESVAIHLTYSVTPVSAPDAVEDEGSGCPSVAMLLVVAGASLFVFRAGKPPR